MLPLREGDAIAVIAPSMSLSIVSAENVREAIRYFEQDLGLTVRPGKHVYDCDPDTSSGSIEGRLEDLHAAFADPSVKAIFTAIGGFNCNQLLDRIDYGLIGRNPKTLCGYSDITCLQIALYARAGIKSLSGPHLSTMAMRKGSEYTKAHLKKFLFQAWSGCEIAASAEWSDDAWYLDQANRRIQPNAGYWCIHPGAGQGILFGGNLSVMGLLRGTPYWPELKEGLILFVEDDDLTGTDLPHIFEQNLVSLRLAYPSMRIVGMLVGRFPSQCAFSQDRLARIIASVFPGTPCIGNVDFGHTNPMCPMPLGASVLIDAEAGLIRLL